MTQDFVSMAQDVKILNNDMSDHPGLSLVSILRNELYLLPMFLDYYRSKGVTRFIMLDDQSTDDSRAFLGKQPDVMLLGSDLRYGDTVPLEERPEYFRKYKSTMRQVHQWRTGLMNRFCNDRWAIQIDVDELGILPDQTDYPKLVKQLEASGDNGIWGVMLDLYLPSMAEFGAGSKAALDPMQGDWHFDGARHVSLCKSGKPPLHRYPGLRHRLGKTFRNTRPMSRSAAFTMRWFGHRKSPGGRLIKPILQKWQIGKYYQSSHLTGIPLSTRHLIPIMHYRYTPALVAKIDWAIESGGYSKGNSDYYALQDLLANISECDGSFMGPNSLPATYENFVATGNAIGLD